MEKHTGKVWLVGAGPSDPGLFTLKGKAVLEQAEVVVYDALAGTGVLSMIPAEAEVINVGKRSSHHTLPQEQISELLVEKALEGKQVVRLKGGDPFLFGRGGEELELLVKNNIPFEVVPGVTSALSVPAYQGIPVTHRDYCSSLHIITGHKRAGQTLDIDFEALVRTGGTLVFLMGVSALGDICRGLLSAGIEPEKPAALLIQGTTAHQERIVATVATLEGEVMRQGAKTPAIIVVGDVCRLADEFSWYDRQPLGGARVLLTRPKELVSETASRMRALGADVLEIPAIRTVKIQENERFHHALRRLHKYQWVVFTSPTGVRIFFEEMAACRIDHRSLFEVHFAVIGSGTKKELEKRGFYPDLMPEIYDGEHLGLALAKACEGSERIMIPRAAIGSQELTAALDEKQLSYDDIATYDTEYENGGCIDLGAELDSIDYVVFTSASTVRGFAAAAGQKDLALVKAVCIGKQTKAAADALGMQTYVAQKPSIDSLVERLAEVYSAEKQ
jgi:uroporphyrinogen III methyltransferase/synthase